MRRADWVVTDVCLDAVNVSGASFVASLIRRSSFLSFPYFLSLPVISIFSFPLFLFFSYSPFFSFLLSSPIRFSFIYNFRRSPSYLSLTRQPAYSRFTPLLSFSPSFFLLPPFSHLPFIDLLHPPTPNIANIRTLTPQKSSKES
jgi:hypothetical protein